jgi:hypothetical protein
MRIANSLLLKARVESMKQAHFTPMQTCCPCLKYDAASGVPEFIVHMLASAHGSSVHIVLQWWFGLLS